MAEDPEDKTANVSNSHKTIRVKAEIEAISLTVGSNKAVQLLSIVKLIKCVRMQ